MLVLLVLLTPLFVIPQSWADINGAKYLLLAVFLSVAVVAWLIGRLSEGAISLPRNVLLFAAALLPLSYLISALASSAPAQSWVSGAGSQDTVAAVAILFALLALCAIVFATDKNQYTGVFPIRALFASGAVVVLLQVARLFVPAWFTLGGVLAGNASSVVGTWHDLGIFVGLSILLASILWSSPSVARGYWRVSIIALGICSFMLLIVIGMQDVWFILSGALFLFALYQWGSALFHERRSIIDAFWRGAVSLLIAVLAVSSGFGNVFLYNHLPTQLQVSQTEVRPSWQGTFAVGQRVFNSNGLIFGSGPNTFARAWQQFKPSGVNQTQFWSSDFSSGVGLVPTSFITVGALAIVAWLALAIALLWRVWQFVRKERLSPARSLAAASLVGSLFLLIFHVLYTPGLTLSMLLFFMLGISVALHVAEAGSAPLRISLKGSPFRSIAGIAFALMCATLILGACVYSARAILSDMLVGKSASDYAQTGNIAHSLALVRSALVAYPDNDAAHRAAIELGLLELQQLMAAGNSASAETLQTTLSQTIQEGLKAVSINSGDYQNWLSLAQLYQSLGGAGVQGAYDNALSAYEKAAGENPTNPLPLVGAAQVAFAQKDATSSLQYLDAAIALKNNLAVAYFLRSQVEAQQNDFTHAVQDAQVAVSLAQQDPLGWYNLGVIFYASGSYDNAAQALRQAVALNTTYANALFVLALADDKLGDGVGAMSAMQEVAKLNPSDATVAQVLANLEAGKPALQAPAAATSTSKKAR